LSIYLLILAGSTLATQIILLGCYLLVLDEAVGNALGEVEEETLAAAALGVAGAVVVTLEAGVGAVAAVVTLGLSAFKYAIASFSPLTYYRRHTV
jgi:hypothetical protein